MACAARHAAARLMRPAAGLGGAGTLLLCALSATFLCDTFLFETAKLRAADPAPINETLSTEQIAERLLATTLTVRVLALPATSPGSAPPAAATAEGSKSTVAPGASSSVPESATSAAALRPFVTQRGLGRTRFTPQLAAGLLAKRGTQISVSSGVSLGDGLIVTFLRPPASAQFRLTLPDGEQAQANLIVQDHYSGLCLLKTDTEGLPSLKLATSAPAIGAWLMTAAASGIDRPLVSQGIVGGIERVPRGTQLPPLLQCDLRTTETSCGSPVVDRQGKLVGIVAAVSETPATDGDAQAGWTFVVPAKYIARLLAARLDHELVILQRQRPTLGLTLVPGEEPGSVRVEHIERGGPAAAAGIRAGDWILETDGRKIRSPYQVMSLVQRKQPGERIDFVIVSDDGQAKQLAVTLSSALPETNPTTTATTLVEPRSETRVSNDNRLEITRRGKVAEVGITPRRPETASARDQQKLLLDQLRAFEQAILQLRAQLKQRDEKLTETDQRVDKLNAELEALRSQMPKP